MSVDFPAFGKPTSAASASSLTSSRSQSSSPYSPCSAKLGRAARVRQEARVPSPAAAAVRGEPPVAVVDEVGEELAVACPHDRALGDGDDEVFAARAVLLLAGTVLARRRTSVRMITEGEQRRDVAIGQEVHVATRAAVAAAGAALGRVRLAAERDRARAAIAATHIDLNLVDEVARHKERIGTTTRSPAQLRGSGAPATQIFRSAAAVRVARAARRRESDA